MAIHNAGGTAYIAIKKNTTGGVGGIFERMYHRYCLDKETFLKHYHKRSNIETTVSMIKTKFGDSVRSKNDTAMKNEALAKIVCHNLCCLVQSAYELGIEATFWDKSAKAPLPAPVEPAPVDETVEAWGWV